MAERTCSVDGCGKTRWARGWCGTHYARWRKTGDPGPAELLAPRYAPDVTERPCSTCKQVLPLVAFPNDTSKPLGVGSRCKSCMRVYLRDWCAAHPERVRGQGNPDKVREWKRQDYARHRQKRLAQATRWAKANPERAAEIKRRHYDANRTTAIERARAWEIAHPQEKLERQRRDRARRKTTQVARITPALLAAKLAYWGGRCWLCDGEPTTWDHVKPQTKGGPHILANLRPACLSCNARKNNRWVFPTSPALARRHPLIARV